jgi:CheY-like chemotaxis protein
MCNSKVILLVDDDADLRSMVRSCILDVRHGADVREAGSAGEALDFLKRKAGGGRAPRPDLILMDIELPDLNGIEVLRLIKTSPGLKDIPVVMLTGRRDAQLMRRAAKYGAEDYCVKHVNPKAFFGQVKGIVERWIGPRGGSVGSAMRSQTRRAAG